jgi:hypothetical protein
MVQVRFRISEFNTDRNEWDEELIAELVADGEEVTISGPRAEWISLDISIIDPDTGEQVNRERDAERWARLLPLAYRSGDIDVEVNEVEAAEPVAAAFHYSTGG